MPLQIGFIRDFVNDEGKKIVFFKALKGAHYPSLKEMFEGVSQGDLDKFLKPEDQKNLFYTVAHHMEGQRKFSSWVGQDLVPFDLDGIDLERIDEYAPLLASTLGFDLNKCAVVYSGNGVHVLVNVPFWKDKDFIKKARLGYRQLLDRMVEACEEKGLPLAKDTTAWDYARILRVPFTKNVKTKDGVEVIKDCTLHYNGLDQQMFTVPVLEKPRDSLGLDSSAWPTPDAKQITKECKFFEWLRDHPDEVHEPHAYVMLSISGHFNDENKTSIEYWDRFSSPSINSKDIAEFTEQALTTSGPRTCDGINQLWGGCDTCPHYQKIKSPILIKGDEYIGTEHKGFTLITAKGGKVRQYEDLVKFLLREYHYKHITATGQIFIYDGGRYVEVKDGFIKNFALAHFTRPTKATERLEFLNYVRDFKSDDANFLNGKENDGLINFNNGVLDIRTGDLLDHSPEYGFFYKLPYDYDPKATCPTWDKYIKEVTLNRKELQNILEEFLGFCLRGGRYKYHKALILSGDGKNGKSTFNDVLKALLGDENISSTSLTKMAVSTFSLSDLQGKLVNISEEEPPHCFKETGIFKNITGENTVTAEKKFKDSFQMVNKAKIIITYNEMPFIGDTSTGMRRRLLVVPFDLDLEHGNKKADADIINKLLAEVSGIANRAIEGFKRLDKQKGFTESKLVDEEVTEIFETSNPFYAWYGERITPSDDPESFVKSVDLYNDYVHYMELNSMSRGVLGIRKVTKMLKQKKFKHGQKRMQGKNFKGIFGIELENTAKSVNF